MAEENKIYVGSLAMETTSDSLRAHFSQFGEVTDCIVMPDKVTGRSRGFGFVSFKDSGAMNAALGTSNTVDGREVACKKAVRESPQTYVQDSGGVYNSVKVFVGGLPATCDYGKFTEYFGRFGQIEDAVVMMDNQTQRHRGFGYVTFAESTAVEAALQNYSANQIDGKWVEVKRCIPQDKMAPGKGKGKPMNGKGKGYGGSDATGGCGAMYGNASTAGYGCYPAAGYGMTPQMASAGYGQPPVAAYGMTAVNGGSSYGSAAGAYGTMAAGGYGAPPPVGSAFGAPVATANYGAEYAAAQNAYGMAAANAYGVAGGTCTGAAGGYDASLYGAQYGGYRSAPY